jgi:hypothetical protein
MPCGGRNASLGGVLDWRACVGGDVDCRGERNRLS